MDESTSRTIAGVHRGHRRPLGLFDAASELDGNVCELGDLHSSDSAQHPALMPTLLSPGP
jgi:hypothetical protein